MNIPKELVTISVEAILQKKPENVGKEELRFQISCEMARCYLTFAHHFPRRVEDN